MKTTFCRCFKCFKYYHLTMTISSHSHKKRPKHIQPNAFNCWLFRFLSVAFKINGTSKSFDYAMENSQSDRLRYFACHTHHSDWCRSDIFFSAKSQITLQIGTNYCWNVHPAGIPFVWLFFNQLNPGPVFSFFHVCRMYASKR